MTNIPRKGDVWHITSGKSKTTGCEMWSDRFAIIVSNDVTNEYAGFVSVVYLTSKQKKRNAPTHVSVTVNEKPAIAVCEQQFAVDKSRLAFKVDTINDDKMTEINQALLFALGITNTLKPTTLFQKWINAIEKYDISLTDTENKPYETTTYGIETNNMYLTMYENERRQRLCLEKILDRMQKDYNTIPYKKTAPSL